MSFQSSDVLISSRLFEEVKWLYELVDNSLFYFADYVKLVVRADIKTNDVQKAFSIAPTLTKLDSKELNCQVAVQILFMGGYKGISKARLLTDNAKNRCRAILFALNNIIKTEQNRNNILWPRLETLIKKLGVFDFDKMPTLGVFQFTNTDYFKLCTKNIYPIIEKMTIIDLLKPLPNEILNTVRRTMLFTLNAYSLNKVFKKQVNGLPYIEFMAKEFSDRKINKIVETESEVIPTPEGIEFHIISLNKKIKQLKAENKQLISNFTKSLDTENIAPIPTDFSSQIKLFTDEINELKENKADLIKQLQEIQNNSANLGVVELAVQVNNLKQKLKEAKDTIEQLSAEAKRSQTLIEESINMKVLAISEKEAAIRVGNNNSKLSIALQDQLNNSVIKYKDLQQRMENLVEECSKKDRKILQLNSESGQLINATYLKHLEDKLQSLTASVKNTTIDEVTTEFLSRCADQNTENLRALFRYREEADRPNRLILAQKRNSTEELTLDSVKWSDKEINEKVEHYLKTDPINELCGKAVSLLGYARTAESYDKLDDALLKEKLKNDKLSQALVSLKDSEIEKTLEHVLDSFVVKSKTILADAISNAEFRMESLKSAIDSKVNTVNQLIMSTLDNQIKNQKKREDLKAKNHKPDHEETTERRENKNSAGQSKGKNKNIPNSGARTCVRELLPGDKFWWGHRNVMLTTTEKFNPSRVLPYADLETSEEMEAQKFYNSLLYCGYKSQFILK
jgi:hypothetical protein